MNCIHDVPIEEGCLVCFSVEKADFIRVLHTDALQLVIEESLTAIDGAEKILDEAKAVAEKKAKRFPILETGGTIPWEVAEQAYTEYSRRFGTSQSLERLAERGGFATEEMDMFHVEWRAHIRSALAVEGLERELIRFKEYALSACEHAENEVQYNSHLSHCKNGCSMEAGAICDKGKEIESKYLLGTPAFWSSSLTLLQELEHGKR